MIGLRRNTFNDVVMAKGRFSKPNVEIEHNTATHSGHNPPPFIDLWPDFDAKSKVNIEKNTFTYNGNYRDGQMIRIARSNILVDGNTFITDNPKQGVGIELIAVDTAGVAGPQKLEDIDIRMNTFKLRRSISNGQLDGPDPSFIGRIIFHYNDLSFSPETLPKRDTYMDHTHTTGPCNYWGDLAKREDVKANRASMNRILTAPPTTFGAGCNDPDTPSPPVPNPSPPVPNPTPTPTPPPTDDPTPSGDGDDRFDGRTRFETSVEISQSQYPNGAKGVIVARSDDPADSVSAVPFAKLMGMPILLTQPDQLHPATATEIKRLIPSGMPRGFLIGVRCLRRPI